MRQTDIDLLTPKFKQKFLCFFSEAQQRFPNLHVYETVRTQARQNELYAQGRTRPWQIVTWTKKSNHKDWNAVDLTFLNDKGQDTWSGDYFTLHNIARKYGIRGIPQESWHFEDDWTDLKLNQLIMSKFEKIFEAEVKDPIFKDFSGNWTLTESDVKYLLEIYWARFQTRMLDEIKKILNTPSQTPKTA